MSNDERTRLSLFYFKGKSVAKGALAVLLIFAIAIISTISIQNNLDQIMLPAVSEDQRPVRSMVFVRRGNDVSFVTCIPDLENPRGAEQPCAMFNDSLFRDQVVAAMNMQFGFSITGSASMVGHDIHRNSSYILSAYHVCRDFNQRYIAINIPTPAKHTLIFRYEPSIILTDFYGNEYRASEVRGDIDNDICLLESEGIMERIEPIRIASEPPEPGDRIYNVASPHGLSQPGAVLSYEGFFAGLIPANSVIKSRHYLSAIPTAPGSSGSPVLNEAGEIISVISYGYIQRPRGPVPPHDMWPNASAGPSLEAIQRLVMPRIIQ